MINTYLAGSLVRVATYAGPAGGPPAGGFCNDAGIPADPDDVFLEYRPGVSAQVVTVAYPSSPIVRDASGLYHADLDTTGADTDTWTYLWKGTGAVQAVAQGSFGVQALP